MRIALESLQKLQPLRKTGKHGDSFFEERRIFKEVPDWVFSPQDIGNEPLVVRPSFRASQGSSTLDDADADGRKKGTSIAKAVGREFAMKAVRLDGHYLGSALKHRESERVRRNLLYKKGFLFSSILRRLSSVLRSFWKEKGASRKLFDTF